MRALYILLSFLIFTSPAFGQITVTDIDYASNVDQADDGTITKIYGGIAGAEADCAGTLDSTTFCNNCTVADTACNRVRIHQTLELELDITVTVDPGTNSTLSVGTIDGTFTPMPITSSTCGTLTEGSSCTFRIAWGSICNEASDGVAPTCQAVGGSLNLIVGVAANAATEPDAANRITIPIDVTIPNNDPLAANGYNMLDCDDVAPSAGICTFLAYPGDKKIYIDQLDKGDSGYPLLNSIQLQFLRIYYSTLSFADANYVPSATNGYASFEIESTTEGKPTSDALEGLENDVQYYFRPGVVDQAFNEAFLANEAEITGGALVAGAGCAGNADLDCSLIATPSAVFGLLTEDVNCFVSTAAYGSSLEKEVQTFRRFRNLYLLQSEFGRKLNNLYYEHGPKLSRLISKHEYLKPIARAGLWPLAQLAKQSNKHGLHIFIIGLFALGFLFTGFIIGGSKLWQRYR